MLLDGNAARAARREGKGETIDYRLGEETFTFPVEFPVSATDLTKQALTERWDTDRYVSAILEHLMGAERWRTYLTEVKPSVDDLNYLYDALWSAYGLTVGESDSSPNSSTAGGESSKPNSNGSTKSTRGRSSQAKPVRAVS